MNREIMLGPSHFKYDCICGHGEIIREPSKKEEEVLQQKKIKSKIRSMNIYLKK